MKVRVPRILGTGYHVPEQVRGNDAPIFDWLKAHTPAGPKLFEGYVDRRVLGEDENLMTIMVPAARKAMQSAGIDAADVDILLGCGSVSAFADPNELCRLHHELDLPERAWVLPLNNEFSNFNAALLLADGLIRARRVKNVLVVVGGNWTRHVDYHTPQSVSAADGAGAAVLGLGGGEPDGHWEIVDHHTITQSSYFGTMFMQGDRREAAVGASPPERGALWTDAYFHITAGGVAGFEQFGVHVVPTAAVQLLQRHGLKGSDVALIAHQASSVLLDAWQAVIQPAQLIQTLEQYANMTVANIPVTLAWAQEKDLITKDSLVLLGIGPEMHANALLLGRAPTFHATG